MRKGEATRATILDAAVSTLCREGLAALSLQPLALKSGLSKSGLYAHFASHEALEVAALDRAAERFLEHVIQPARREGSGLASLCAVFRRWLDWPQIANYPGACPFIVAAIALSGREGAARERIRRLTRDFALTLEALAAAAVRRRELDPTTDPATLVRELMALRLGHHWQAVVRGDPRAREQTDAQFGVLIARHRPA